MVVTTLIELSSSSWLANYRCFFALLRQSFNFLALRRSRGISEWGKMFRQIRTFVDFLLLYFALCCYAGVVQNQLVFQFAIRIAAAEIRIVVKFKGRWAPLPFQHSSHRRSWWGAQNFPRTADNLCRVAAWKRFETSQAGLCESFPLHLTYDHSTMVVSDFVELSTSALIWLLSLSFRFQRKNWLSLVCLIKFWLLLTGDNFTFFLQFSCILFIVVTRHFILRI